VSSGTLAVLYRAHHDLPAGLVTPVNRRGSSVARQGRSIARRRREIAVACDDVTSCGRHVTRLGGLLAFQGAAIAKITPGLEHRRVAAFGEDAIACFLIAFGGSLIGIGRGLVAVGSRLVSISVGLIPIGARLVVGERFRRSGDALLIGLDRPIRRSHRKIV